MKVHYNTNKNIKDYWNFKNISFFMTHSYARTNNQFYMGNWLYIDSKTICSQTRFGKSGKEKKEYKFRIRDCRSYCNCSRYGGSLEKRGNHQLPFFHIIWLVNTNYFFSMKSTKFRLFMKKGFTGSGIFFEETRKE